MRINGFRCDNCSKEQLITPLALFSSADGAPLEWFTVKKAMLLAGPTWMFCSMSCLYQWSTNRLEDESKEVSE